MQFCLEVAGDYASFNRPEMKVERVSYDVITPSAARAIFEAVFWKPPIEWRIQKIEVLKPLQWTTVRRNEVSEVASARNASPAMKSGTGQLGLYIEEKRQQRASLILKDVAYRLHAEMHVHTDRLEGEDTPGKYYAMFERRAKGGQVFHRPYLGCREFDADVRWYEDSTLGVLPIDDTRELGWMLYDMDFSDPTNIKPLFFNARMDRGIVQVPSRYSKEVRG